MPRKILILDDATFKRMSLKRFLVKNGFEVFNEVESTKQAILKYKEINPDLVILDIKMSEADGIKAVEEIKASLPEAKIVICSAQGQSSMVFDAIVAGARDFIVKPFQEALILQKIKGVLKN